MKTENNRPLVAKTLYGFEPILAKELRQLGAIDVKEKDKAKRDSESLPRNGDDDFQEYYSPGK